MTRLTILGLQTLEDHSLRGDIMLVCSIMTGRFDLPLEEFFTRPSLDNLRGNSLKHCHRRFQLNNRDAAFLVRIVINWNTLPPSLINATPVMSLTNALGFNWDMVVSLCNTT